MQDIQRTTTPLVASSQPTHTHEIRSIRKGRRSVFRFAPALLLLPALAFCFGCGSNPVHGFVSKTSNPQVALYSVGAETAAKVTIHFGLTTDYGLTTSTASIPPGGGDVSIYVAGMRGNSTYHMQAEVAFADGRVAKDVDRTFQTSSYPANLYPTVSAVTAAGQTPQPGVEVLNSVSVAGEIAVFDLSGHLIWAYYDPTLTMNSAAWLAPKLLPNGDFIAMCASGSSGALVSAAPPGTPNLVREFDLAGNTVKQITMDQLNTRLAANNYDVSLVYFSHDITVLPNGHWLVLANTFKNVVLNGQSTPTRVLGDVIVDLDENLQPVWVWNEFDHLDVNRHPWNFPDWTHTNAVIYSPDDGNLLVSIRHQNWIVKVDYADGAGSGNILWRLGAGGDLKLVGGTDPTDWPYAQHGIHFTTQTTAGRFGLAVMDNGDDRAYPGDDPTSLQTCGNSPTRTCYTSIPIYDIDEGNKTATIEFHQVVPPALYNAWGGNAEQLDNGDVEYDLCGIPKSASQVVEVTSGSNPQVVWSMNPAGAATYRAYRLPSLYPGVQW